MRNGRGAESGGDADVRRAGGPLQQAVAGAAVRKRSVRKHPLFYKTESLGQSSGGPIRKKGDEVLVFIRSLPY